MYTTQAPLYLILAIVFVTIGIIIICFVIAILSQRRNVERLRKSKEEAEITTLENERKRMAADIHDELGPLLSAAKSKYSEVECFSLDDEKLLKRGHQIIDEIVLKMRRIAKNLMPTVLIYKGPIEAIKEFIELLDAGSNLKIEFEPGTVPTLSQLQSVNVFRIVQEIINNTLKHAGAANLKIAMYTDRNKLVISTVDDGRGFNHKIMIREGGGLGLSNMQSRADMLKGEVRVRSKIGQGTNYCITIPL